LKSGADGDDCDDDDAAGEHYLTEAEKSSKDEVASRMTKGMEDVTLKIQ